MSEDSGPPLAILTDIEARRAWPECLELYRETMLSMARDLRSDGPRREQRRHELHVLLEHELHALLMCRAESDRRARRDAFNELVSDVEGLAESLEAASRKLTARRPPNFVSFFKAKLIWKANDVLESEYRRHERRVYPVADPLSLRPIELQSLPGARRNERRVLVREIFETFGSDPIDAAVLVGLMQDVPIAEIARRTGRSRQQIYRLLERIRNWSEVRSDE
ncbi:MAG: hypothetical protein R3F65_29840 [bacterium]